MNAVWRLLAYGVVGLHFAFLAYVLVGGFLAWRWPRTVVLHAAAVIWAFLIVATRVPCPLTALQNNLRERAGQHPLDGSFINLYVRSTFYPAGDQAAAQAALAVVVLVSWIGLMRYVHHRRPRQVAP